MMKSYLGVSAYQYAVNVMKQKPTHYSLKYQNSTLHYGTDLVVRFFFKSGEYVDFLTGVSQIASDIRTLQPKTVETTKRELIQYFANIGLSSLAATKPKCTIDLEKDHPESPYNQLGMNLS